MSDDSCQEESEPFAVLSCRMVQRENFHGQPPAGFSMSDRENSDEMTVMLGQEPCRVGRSQAEADLLIDHPYVSREHLVFYTIVYDAGETEYGEHMVYVRDEQSTVGTFLNGHKIGLGARKPSTGYLLNHGDVVRIEPYWEFEVILPSTPKGTYTLTKIQRFESMLFSNRFTISPRVLGSGAHGTVNLATDFVSGKQLACKIVDLDKIRLNGASHTLELRLREVDLLSKVRHQNLLSYEHAFRSKHTIYMFTELATGGDLLSMANSNMLSMDDLRFVIYFIIRGLAHLHELDIAHRDIKPENIFFAHGPWPKSRVIIGDLGGSKAASWGRMQSRDVGTPIYKSPEMSIRGENHTKAVDMWALGIGILILSRLRPELLDNIENLQYAATQESLDSLVTEYIEGSRIRDYVNWEDFIRKCLRLNPAERITAAGAKKHPLLNLHSRALKEWKLFQHALWRPTYQMPPPIEELPDLGALAEYKHVNLVKTKISTPPLKRKFQSEELDKSPEAGVSRRFNLDVAENQVAKRARVG